MGRGRWRSGRESPRRGCGRGSWRTGGGGAYRWVDLLSIISLLGDTDPRLTCGLFSVMFAGLIPTYVIKCMRSLEGHSLERTPPPRPNSPLAKQPDFYLDVQDIAHTPWIVFWEINKNVEKHLISQYWTKKILVVREEVLPFVNPPQKQTNHLTNKQTDRGEKMVSMAWVKSGDGKIDRTPVNEETWGLGWRVMCNSL